MKPYYIRIAIAHAENLGNKKWQKKYNGAAPRNQIVTSKLKTNGPLR